MSIRYVSLSISLLLLLLLKADAQHYSFDNYSVKDGLIQSNVNSMVQDNDGNVWFATDGGLCKFDGSSFKNYSIQKGLLNNEVRALCKDASGNIWIGYSNGKISIHPFRTDTIVAFAPAGLNPKRIFSISLDRNNSIWIATLNAGAIRLKMPTDSFALNKITTEAFDHNQQVSDNVYNIFQSHDGMLWMLTDKGIFRFNERTNQTEHFEPGNLPPYEYISITEDKNKNLWLGSWGSGLLKIDLNISDSSITNVDLGLADQHITSLISSSTGQLYAGTWGSGILELENDKPLIISDANGLTGNKINCLLEDREHNLWIGMEDKGADYFKGKRFSLYTQASGLTNENVNALLQDDAGKIWIATNNGIDVMDGNDGTIYFKHLSLGELVQTDQVSCLAKAPGQEIIVGTFGGGAVIIDDKTKATKEKVPINNKFNGSITTSLATGIIRQVPIADKFITAIAVIDDDVWLGSVTGLTVYNLSTKSLKQLPDDSLVNGINVAFIFKQDNDHIWIGTHGSGLILFSGLHFEKIGKEKGFASTSAASACKDEKGNIWIGTEGEGLFKWGDGKFTSFTTASGLSSDFITLLQPDNDGDIWVGTNNGLNKYDHQQQQFIFYGKEDGFTPQETRSNSSLKDANGNLWFGTSVGVVEYQKQYDRRNDVVPIVNITGIFFGTENYLNSKNISFPFNHNSLSINYHAICFSGNGKVRYQYKLTGLNKDWQPITNMEFAVYSYLEPGNYTFELRACNNDGVWSEQPVTLSFSITPPFWKTLWFYLLVVTVALITLGLIIKFRTNSLIRQRDVMEKQVKLRTAELHASNDQLASTLNQLKDAQQQLIHAEKMSSLGQLTAGIAHEINNPINFVSANIGPLKRDVGELTDLLEKYLSLNEENYSQQLKNIETYKKQVDVDYTLAEIKTLLKGIEDGSQRTTSIVKGLRNFSRLDEGELKLADINEGVTSTLMLLKNKLEEHIIKVTSNLDDIPRIKCYPQELNQVFMNLFSNAIDAMGKNGTLTISTSFLPAQNSDVTSQSSVKISVRDTGLGMSDEVKKKIFDPFFTTKAVGSGTGLGLSISYGIIEKHKGKIEVISEPLKGTEFIITLPVA